MMNRELLLSARLRDLLKMLVRPYQIQPFMTQLDQVDFVAAVTGERREAVKMLELEFFRNHAHRQRINERLIEKRGTVLGGNAITGAGFYMLVRVARPSVMVETGVFDGINTANFLLAMRENRHGRLISIDLPAVGEIVDSTRGMPTGRLPPDCAPGWVIPDELRDRHELLLGDSRELLPKVLEREGTIDAFLHDSLHTYDHMLFEYETAWPRIREGGLFMSDDILAWGARNVFRRFCRRMRQRYHTWGALGALVKRTAASGG